MPNEVHHIEQVRRTKAGYSRTYPTLAVSALRRGCFFFTNNLKSYFTRPKFVTIIRVPGGPD